MMAERDEARERLANVRIFKPDGAHGTWPDDVRMLAMKYLTLRTSPSEIPELIASTALAVVPWAADAGFRVPSIAFVRGLRVELGVLARSDAALTLAESKRIVCAGTDASPVDQSEVATFNGRLENKDGSMTDLIIGGAYRVSDTTALGESNAAENMFARRALELDAVIEAYATLYSKAEAEAALPDSANIGLHQLGGGGVIITDNASAALKGARVLSELVAKAVKEKMGEEWETMAEDEVRRATP